MHRQCRGRFCPLTYFFSSMPSQKSCPELRHCGDCGVVSQRCLISCLWLLLISAGAAQTPVPAVQSIQAVAKLPRAGQVVHVRGVMTAAEPGRFFLQDKTGALSVTLTATAPALSPGDVCEVTGTLTPQVGLEMQPETITITGKAALPAAKDSKAGDLKSGAAKNQRVKLSGLVHEVGTINGAYIISVESMGTSLVVTWRDETADATALKAPLHLLDAMVELEGVAPPLLSSSALPGGLRIVLADAKHLKITQPGHADPFSRPLRTLASMQGPEVETGERFRVRGTVSYSSPAGWFYFQDETGSARGNSSTFIPLIIGWPYRDSGLSPELKPGDQIELVGARIPGAGAMPSLSHCLWRVLGHTQPPDFEETTPQKLITTDRQGYPVQISGQVTDIQFQRDAMGFINHYLWLKSHGTSCRALVQKKRGYPMPVSMGDYVRVQGTASFTYDTTGDANTLRINVNEMADIQRIPPPPFWTDPSLLRWTALGASIVLFSLFWIILLRRQVRAQTVQLRENARRLEAQLEQEKDLNEMKSRFVFTVSHEFRNPLAAIMSCADVLQRMPSSVTPAERDTQVSGIQQNVRRMADMMEEVLLLGRAEAGRLPCEPEPVDLPTFCLKLVDQISSASNQRCPIELSLAADLTPQMLDPSLLQHILGNLITNAVKYSPPGMSVELTVKLEPSDVIFTIRDHGIGIPTLDRPRIFEPFHRGSNVESTAGTGLGLAIAQRCACAHGGSISCESDREEGTTFTVRLPCFVIEEAPIA
jgi:signal transduction histidine kinase